MLKRLFQHVFYLPLQARRLFPQTTLDRIAQAVASSEKQHRGEIRVIVEHALDVTDVMRAVSARQRAEALFSEYRVWDTEDNSGILLYVLLADHAFEIVADRGINHAIEPAVWQTICQQLQQDFQRREFEQGVLTAIHSATQLLTEYFPARAHNPNELPDIPVVR